MINAAVEGLSDVEMAKAVIRAAGKDPGRVIVRHGKSRLDPLIAKYNEASRQSPWMVFRDSDKECPVELRLRLLAGAGAISTSFRLQLVKPMAEAWLMADRSRFAQYFGVRESVVPEQPELLAHPKQTLISLAERSRLQTIRRSLALPDGRVGPLYTSTINAFAAEQWDPVAAAENSPSLQRAITWLHELQ